MKLKWQPASSFIFINIKPNIKKYVITILNTIILFCVVREFSGEINTDYLQVDIQISKKYFIDIRLKHSNHSDR